MRQWTMGRDVNINNYGFRHKRLDQYKVVVHKSRRVVKDALKKMKRTQFVRTIKRNVGNVPSKWINSNNQLAMHTGVAIVTSAVVGIATGGILVEAVRAGVSVVVSNAVLKRSKKRKGGGEDNKRPIDKALNEAKRDYLHTRQSTTKEEGTRYQPREQGQKRPIDKVLDEAKRGHLHYFNNNKQSEKNASEQKGDDQNRVIYRVCQNQTVKKKK